MTTAEVDPRRRVPRTDAVLADPRLVAAAGRLGRDVVKQQVVAAQGRVRSGELAPEDVADAAVAALPGSLSSTDAVLNATGVVLHTNLGRAPLSPAAVEAVTAAAGYADVEFDLATGRRARRGRGALDALAAAVPAAGSVLAVNNGAAALVLATTALAAGREVVISRGEMVEIGDGFRLPELIASTGARLREVGTTNRTAAADYAAALGPDTGCILKVHPSNFRVEGFTSAASVDALARLGVPLVVDIGSGLLAPDPLLPAEPDADSTLRAGADLVTASGDKLLGGPQAGLLLGRTDVVERLRRHPLARALRVDKLTLAALEATLRGPVSPTWAALRADPDVLRARAEQLVAALAADGLPAAVVPSDGAVGGGGAPGLTLPGWAVALPEHYAVALRTGRPAVVGRVERGRCLLDLRCVGADDDARLLTAVRAARPRVEDRGTGDPETVR
ncbi:L-seryl-tRNA(Sec) selenium transferase [Friedmanniella luteola]|uniref:L-seryl-tRNA(Sec) selenium transferase n=1 Tax=Friedmanniella luteola TaxID=546871 RepID=A0A1H1L3J3_9ACTN|nr:L-seryl-tRNA(Sec) selenium transferase [Friedmanniella luteola]SDR69128.1 L-seryl-tRNA(Sec) selenium transferase [Friedmanniella luteola]